MYGYQGRKERMGRIEMLGLTHIPYWYCSLVRTYCIAQRMLLNARDDLNRKKAQKEEEYTHTHTADSFCPTVETNTILWNNYIPIKINFIKTQDWKYIVKGWRREGEIT